MNFLFQKFPSRYLAIIRILIGAWFFIDMVSMLVSGHVKKVYIDPVMHFPFYGFEWIEPLPGNWMYVLFITLAIASLAVTLGYKVRLFLVYFLIGFGYAFMCDIVYTMNKFYLLLLLGFVLLFTHSDWALVFRKPDISKFVARWQILIFQLMFALVYFYSGISKINPDWLFHAQPLSHFLRDVMTNKWMDLETFKYVAFVFSYCGIAFDLCIIILLTNSKTRLIGQVLQTGFHTLNFIFLRVGSLSIFTCLLTWVLFPPPGLKRKLKIEHELRPDQLAMRKSKKMRIAIGFAAFLLINLLIPHRHYLTGNNVNWTDKGHRFSWRLMTRTKRGSDAKFYVSSNQIKKPILINQYEYLNQRQYTKMRAETDLLIVFAHYLKEEYQQKGHDDIKVTVTAMARLNGREPQLLVDPTLDLTKVSRTLLRDEVSTQLSKR